MAYAPPVSWHKAPVEAGYRRLLVPIDHTAEAGRAMETACALAAEHGATVTAVSVIEIPPLLPLNASMVEEETAARETLARAEAIADTYGLKLRPRRVRSRDAGKAIVALVVSENIELVVIGAARDRGFHRRRMAFDGTVRTVLAKAPSRVLVVAGPKS